MIRMDKPLRTKLMEILARHRSYKAFSNCKESAYEYASLFGISVCLYCNMNYIHVVIEDESGEKRARPHFDHFVPKSKCAKLAMNPRNLIPACPICNSPLKGMRDFSSRRQLHPFRDDFDSIMRFYLDIADPGYMQPENIAVGLEPACDNSCKIKKAENSIKIFCLRERYQLVKGEAVQVMRLVKTYLEHRTREDFQLVHGNECDDGFGLLLYDVLHCDINNTSLGKMKRDVMRQFLDNPKSVGKSPGTNHSCGKG